MTAAVLLAAGSARRFGGTQKLLAAVPTESGDVPLVRHSVTGLLQAGIQNIVVVTGRDADQVRRALDGMALRFALNPEYTSGLSTSLKKGVSEATRLWPKMKQLLIALGDQPLTGTGILETLLSRTRSLEERDPYGIIAPRYQGEAGNPVLFAGEFIPDLLLVPTGDRGARVVIERNPSRVRYVDFDRAMPLDVDTMSDLSALTNVHHQ
ncbi:MAG TPA: nucleotidyltransferase family protein [Gemmatimonadaceae bacterium]|nr:nucleotidyltransferase family protein [Gemmatimonadaceae bacterium]